MKTVRILVVLATFVFLSVGPAQAAQTEPVEKRPKVEKGNIPEPAVTIRSTPEANLKEYRINGVLRAIKVTPKNGMPPYYLVDENATGVFIKFGPDMNDDVIPPRWILFSW